MQLNGFFARSCRAMNWVVLVALTLQPGFVLGVATEPEEIRSAEDVLQHASDELLNLIDESRTYVDDDPERFYGAVEMLLSPVVDFKGFARSVMAAYYKDATPEQRDRFADTFKWGLVRSYALVLTEFRDGEVAIVPADRPPRNPRRRSVTMEIRLNTGEVYPVVYSMKLGKDENWRVGNIIINGVNIGLTYRSQFASAMQDARYGGELDQVIDAWAELLDSGGEEEEVAAPATASAEGS